MGDIAIASVRVRATNGLDGEAQRILAETRPPSHVERERSRMRSTDPQALFEYVSAISDRVYRHGRRASLGGRGEMALHVGLAFDANPDDAVERATRLCDQASDHVILADDAFVRKLDPLRCLSLDLDSTRTIDGRRVFETFPPDQRDCFVIMPMGVENDDTRRRSERVLDLLIRPACRELELRPIAPTRQNGERISVDVFGALHLSNLAVAYLGGSPWNPNVMVEVGYRMALGRPLVLVADQEPPFDLGDRRSVLLTTDWADRRDDVIKSLVAAMRERLENGAEGGELYPVAEIEVDERPVSDERKRHRVASASEATASLFGLPRDVLVGMAPSDLIAHLGELMANSAQFNAFQEEQAALYTTLSSPPDPFRQTGSALNATATIPVTFFAHPERAYNGRAFLPCIINHSRRPGVSSTQRVVYIEVTQAVHRRPHPRHGELRMCELKNGNGGLAFELYARSYDAILDRLSNYREVRDRHVAAVQQHCFGPDARILDIGAGTGNVTLPLVASGHNVEAIDKSQAMLDRLMEKRGTTMRGGLCAQRRDCRSLRNFADDTFDAVTMGLVLFAMADREAAQEALSEATRVLKRGGLLVLTEPTRDFRLEPLLKQAESELRAQPDWAELEPHWNVVQQANSIINPERNEFLPAQEIHDVLKHTLEGITIQDAYRGYCWTLIGRKR